MKKTLLSLIMAGLLLAPAAAFAHSPICDCMDNDDNTITCEGGFSDGSSAAGVKMTVVDASGAVLVEGKMNQDSEYTFEKPSVDYKVIFDAGAGHTVEVDGKKIVK